MITDLDSADSAVDKATGYKPLRVLDSRHKRKIFIYFTVSIPALGPPILLSSGYFSREVRRPGREAHHSPPSRPEVKNDGAILPLYRMSSWSGALVIKHGDGKRLGSVSRMGPGI
jgi:hypothetical protein